jgi:hypothetical protein
MPLILLLDILQMPWLASYFELRASLPCIRLTGVNHVFELE